MAKHSFTAEVYSKEHYDRIFAEIADLSKDLTPSEINQEIQKRINLTFLLGQQLEQEVLSGFDFYRLRVPKTDESIDENESSSFSYPPDPDLLTSKGRANIEKQQVFYASADGHTVFCEMADSIKQGESIAYLTKWGIRDTREPVFMRSLFLGTPESSEDNFSSFMAKGIREAMEIIVRDIPEPHKENFIYGQTKYADLFTTKGKSLYHISSAIAHGTFVNALKQGADIPILTYPSVAKEKASINFAIRKDFVDKHMYIKEVYKLTVNKIDNEKVSTSVMARGLQENGQIKWYYPHFKAKYSTAFVSSDGKLENARNMKPGDLFTACCKEHTMNLQELLKKMGVSESLLLDIASQLPMKCEYDGPKAIDCLVPIPIDFDLYLNSDISEKGKIKCIMIPVKYHFSYVELKQAS